MVMLDDVIRTPAGKLMLTFLSSVSSFFSIPHLNIKINNTNVTDFNTVAVITTTTNGLSHFVEIIVSMSDHSSAALQRASVDPKLLKSADPTVTSFNKTKKIPSSSERESSCNVSEQFKHQ